MKNIGVDCFNLIILLVVQYLYYFEINRLNIVNINHQINTNDQSDQEYTILIELTNSILNLPMHYELINKTIKVVLPIYQYIKENDLLSFDYQLIYNNLLDGVSYSKDLLIIVNFESFESFRSTK